jgi:hypothetical protein
MRGALSGRAASGVYVAYPTHEVAYPTKERFDAYLICCSEFIRTRFDALKLRHQLVFRLSDEGRIAATIIDRVVEQ